jgi:hypothetical protein
VARIALSNARKLGIRCVVRSQPVTATLTQALAFHSTIPGRLEPTLAAKTVPVQHIEENSPQHSEGAKTK